MQQRANDRIIAVEKSAVLHNRGALLADQIGAGANADPFFLATQRHVENIPVVFYLVQQAGEIDIRQRRNEIDTRAFQSADDQSRRFIRFQA